MNIIYLDSTITIASDINTKERRYVANRPYKKTSSWKAKGNAYFYRYAKSLHNILWQVEGLYRDY